MQEMMWNDYSLALERLTLADHFLFFDRKALYIPAALFIYICSPDASTKHRPASS